MEWQEMASEEQPEIINRGIEEGLEKPRSKAMPAWNKASQIRLILCLVQRRIADVNPDLVSRIGELSVEQLECLAEEVIGFSSLSDLMVWLEQNNG
jgi:hypothetical protein